MIRAEDYQTPKEFVKANQTSLMKHFLGIEPDARQHRNPFRKDRKPSCTFYISSRGTLYFKDWATEECLDVLDIIRKTHGCTFTEALDIARTAKLESIPELVKPPRVFTFVPISEYHDYWRKLGVSKELLHEYSVFNVKYVYCDGNILFKGTKYNPIFGYSFPSGHTKFYRPLTVDKEKKWTGNANEKDINGFYQLPWFSNLLIITKSMKDLLVIRSMGFSSVLAPQSENAAWDSSTVSQLKKRFEHIVVIYDNDAPGIKYGTAVAAKFGAKAAFFTKEKDIAAHVAKFGFKKAKKALRKCLKKSLEV